MSGLGRVLKIYGRMSVSANGKTVWWRWDYFNDKARLESEMTKEEIMASEKAKWNQIKSQLASTDRDGLAITSEDQ